MTVSTTVATGEQLSPISDLGGADTVNPPILQQLLITLALLQSTKSHTN